MATPPSDAPLALPPLVAVLRAGTSTRLPAVCEVLYGEGVRAFEFTLTTPDAHLAMRRTRDLLPDDAVLGVGTVLTRDDVDASVDAGAQFLVSPISDPALLARARELDAPYVPGTLTPSEAHAAWRAGAAMVKVWPCAPAGGTAFVRALSEVLRGVPLMPSGGIGVDEVGDYLAAGATCVGLGGGFQGDAAEPGGDLDALAGRARRALAGVDR